MVHTRIHGLLLALSFFLLLLSTAPPPATAARDHRDDSHRLRVLAPNTDASAHHRFVSTAAMDPPATPSTKRKSGPHRTLAAIITGVLNAKLADPTLFPNDVATVAKMTLTVVKVEILQLRGVDDKALQLEYDGNAKTPLTFSLSGVYLWLGVSFKFGLKGHQLADTLTVSIPGMHFGLRLFHDGMTHRLILRDFSMTYQPITVTTESLNPLKRAGYNAAVGYLNGNSFQPVLRGAVHEGLTAALADLELKRDAFDRTLLPRAAAGSDGGDGGGETFIQRVQRAMGSRKYDFELKDQVVGPYLVTINNLALSKLKVDTRHVHLKVGDGLATFTITDVTVHGSVDVAGDALPSCSATFQVNSVSLVVEIRYNTGTMQFRLKDAAVVANAWYPLWVALSPKTWMGRVPVTAADVALKAALATPLAQDTFLAEATKGLKAAIDDGALGQVQAFVTQFAG